MKRLASLVGVVAIGLLGVTGCATEVVGDPCAPGRPMNQPCSPGRDGGSAGCFLGTEIYIETQSLECRSRICLVYRYPEATDSNGAARPKHVYCTCRCGVPPSLAATTESSVLCTCPESFSCVSIAGEQYNEGVRGSYCVRTSTVQSAATP